MTFPSRYNFKNKCRTKIPFRVEGQFATQWKRFAREVDGQVQGVPCSPQPAVKEGPYVARVKDAISRGLTQHEAAAEIGCTRACVSKICARHNLRPRRWINPKHKRAD